MYYSVYCRPDIRYGTNILSKLPSTTSDYHYSFLKNLARYLNINRDWGIIYKMRGPLLDLPETKFNPIL